MDTTEGDHSSDFLSNEDQEFGRSEAAIGDGHTGKPPIPADTDTPDSEGLRAMAAEGLCDGLTIRTAPQLQDEDFDPLTPLVEYEDRPVLHEGMSLMAAKPKMGKSMLALNISLAVASGGRALGHGKARQGRVLYLDLDGSKRDMQSRLDAMCRRGGGSPKTLHTAHPDGAVPKVNEGMLYYLKRMAPAYELIVIDTVKRIRPHTDGRRNAYDEDYEFLHPIARLGRDHDTSILAIHHLNKAQRGDPLDKVSGSTGLTAAPETVMVLEGERGTGKAELAVQSRRGPDECFQLEFDSEILTWKLGGIAKPGTEARAEVWSALQDEDGWVHYAVLADRLGTAKSTVSEHLKKLFNEDGMPVEKNDDGEYRAG